MAGKRPSEWRSRGKTSRAASELDTVIKTILPTIPPLDLCLLSSCLFPYGPKWMTVAPGITTVFKDRGEEVVGGKGLTKGQCFLLLHGKKFLFQKPLRRRLFMFHCGSHDHSLLQGSLGK